MSKKNKKQKDLSVPHVPIDDANWLTQKAQAEGRSVANLIKQLIRQAREAEGKAA